MLNDNAKKWVDALRSGDYKQGKNVLHATDGYCCLGVACELYAQEFPLPREIASSGNERFDGHVSVPPSQVVDWLGLRHELGVFVNAPDACESLAGMNDKGTPFAEIADFIESEPEGLFA